MGFSTGKWEGNVLKITTTHLKEDYYRRNGIFASDKATITTYWMRHGDYLTWINIVKAPVYLTEPLIRSGEYRLNLGAAFPAHPCTPTDEGSSLKYSRYSRSSRLANRAPRRPRCDNGLLRHGTSLSRISPIVYVNSMTPVMIVRSAVS